MEALLVWSTDQEVGTVLAFFFFPHSVFYIIEIDANV